MKSTVLVNIHLVLSEENTFTAIMIVIIQVKRNEAEFRSLG